MIRNHDDRLCHPHSNNPLGCFQRAGGSLGWRVGGQDYEYDDENGDEEDHKDDVGHLIRRIIVFILC